MAVAIVALALSRLRGRGADMALDQRLDSLNQRLGELTGQSATYQETMDSVNRALGGLAQTSQRLLEVGKGMRDLQDILAAPTLRGGLGELMLEEMLKQTLPAGFYETQYTFRNGARVDAVVRLSEGLVSVDAKFPLESFRRLMDSEEAERRTHRAQFRRDVKRHIDAIADRYICPGETLDFALMYIPAENVYYEIVLKESDQNDILEYGWSRRGMPTSPNSFYAYLQVVALGLKGLQVEQNAQRMLESLTRLRRDFDRFADDYRLVGTHLGRARAKFDDGLPKLEAIQRALPGQLTTGPSIEPLDAAEADERTNTGDGAWAHGPLVDRPPDPTSRTDHGRRGR